MPRSLLSLFDPYILRDPLEVEVKTRALRVRECLAMARRLLKVARLRANIQRAFVFVGQVLEDLVLR